MSVNDKLVSAFRKQFINENKKWCPDEAIRLNILVERHFVERFLDRFDPADAMLFLQEVMDWIDKNYCNLLYDAHVSDETKYYRITLEHGTVAMVLFNKTVRVRTCFTGNEPYEGALS